MTTAPTKEQIQLQTPAEVPAGERAVVTHAVAKTAFLEMLLPVGTTRIVRVTAGGQDREIPVGHTPQENAFHLTRALGDGFTVPESMTLALTLVNGGGEPAVLAAALTLIPLMAEPIPFDQAGALLNPPAAGVETLAAPPVAAPGTLPEMAAAAMGGAAWTPGPDVPPPAMESLEPAGQNALFRNFKPILRHRDDPRPPPPKTAPMQSSAVRMGAARTPPQTAVGQPGPGGVRSTPVALGPAMGAAPPSLRPGVRTTPSAARVSPPTRPGVVMGPSSGIAGGASPAGVLAAEPQQQIAAAMMPTAHAAPTGGRYPVVVQHGVAKSVERMLDHKTPIARVHREIMQGALGRARDLDPAAYAGEDVRARLWQNGTVIAWLAPVTIQALIGMMLMGQGTGTGPIDHDSVPDLVDAFHAALTAPPSFAPTANHSPPLQHAAGA